MRIFLIILFFLAFTLVNAQYKMFSGIHDTINLDLSTLLENTGFGKATYYYDDIEKKDGVWNFYPMINLSKSLTAVWVSTIPGRNNGYTFLLIFDINTHKISDTLGPYYDSSIDAIKGRIKKNNLNYLKVRLSNPPEVENSKYTIREYKRIEGNLKEYRSRDNY
ncbi:MAG TPA: hypothetical protein P5248_00675 [Bacteroidales bacterium]|nr:hypothetical protein [Bacteroidales bacterium]